ncbi:MAG: hypothetical protein AB7V04_08195, partial [Desulfomonilaceae bacterium]
IKSARLEGEDVRVSIVPNVPVLPPKSAIPLEIKMSINGQTQKPYYLGKLYLETDHPIEQDIELKYLIKLDPK